VAQDGLNGQDGTSPEGFLINWRGGLASAPSNQQKGWAYYNTSQKKSFIWDGSSWQILAQDGADGEGSGGSYQSRYLYVLVYTPNGNYFENVSQSIGIVDFGKVGIGSIIRTSTFYISIQGTAGSALALTGSPAIQLSGANADCFSVTQPSVTTADTGTYIMDASISFTPNSTGIKTATITIPNNSPDKPDFSFTVRGEGSIWPKTFDGSEGDGDDRITCSVTDSQGNLYFIGYGFELVNHHSGYDWWIKKIDNAGNEVITGWNKKLDFYENYNSSTSSSYTQDKPTNAVIDTTNNLIVSDGYTTIKFSSTGEITWQKDIGGTLYNDLQNNVFIETSSSITKYNSSGTQLWTKAFTGKLTFNSSGDMIVYNNNILRCISSNGTETWTKTIVYETTGTSILANTWHDAIKVSGIEDFYVFSAVSGTSFSVWLNRSGTGSSGDGTKTASVSVSAYWEDTGESAFTSTSSIFTTPRTFTANRTGNIILQIGSSTSSGTYSIRTDRSFNKINAFFVNSAVFDDTGNIYIGGYGNNLFDQYSKKDVWIKKYDQSGTEITSGWNKKYDWGHSDDEWATDIRFDGTNIIVIGQGDDLVNGASKNNTWVKKFTTAEAELYAFVIPDNNATLVKIDSSENYYFSSGSSSSTLFRKYSSSGVLLNTYSWNSKSPYISPPLFIMDNANNAYMYGYASNLVSSASGYDWIIRKFNSMGIEQ